MESPPDGDGRSRIGQLTERIRTGARRAFAPAATGTEVTRAIPATPATRKLLPVRYQIKDDNGTCQLTCSEASNIAVRVERGLTVSASSARKYPRGTIFLDGAAQGEPFLDSAKGIYNLDHHEGCVRAFTVATCEQAMILILKGLDLDDEAWTVWVNDPDFDAVLAVWLLLNHRRLSSDHSSLRQRLMPIVRLQGVIDAHGFELQELTAFPPGLQERTLEAINELRADELALKRDGAWGSTDLLEFVRSALQRIDEMVYTPGDFEGRSELEELGRVRISPQRIAIACRSESGIYEVEEQLREIHSDRLGLVILQKDDATYTLRQTDPFLRTGLDQLYERLNLLDPAADGDQRWGGSGDIGGSPRGPGTALGLDAIMEVCGWVFRPPSLGRRLATIAGGVAGATLALGLAAAASGDVTAAVPGLLIGEGGWVRAPSSLVLAILGLGLTILGSLRRPGYYGWRRPRRLGFLALLPVTCGVVAAGGGWVSLAWLAAGDTVAVPNLAAAATLLAGVAGLELLIHGALHGMVVTAYPVMLTAGRRFVSVPNLVAALVYAAAVMTCLEPPTSLEWLVRGALATALWGLAAFLMGLVCGCVRERWGSVWAPVILHVVSVLFVLGGFSALL